MSELDVRVVLKINNYYEGDSHPVRTRVETRIPRPPADEDARDEWEQDCIMPHTGTGRTEGNSAYFVEIVESDDPALVGLEMEFGT